LAVLVGDVMAASGKGARTRNPQGEGFRLRQELIAAAGRLLASGADTETLTLRGMAREAGVAAPSVYLQFANKEALLQAVVDEHFTALRHAIEAGSAAAQDAPSGLLAGCLAYCRYAAEHPGSYRILFNTPRPRNVDSQFAGSEGAVAFQTLVDGVAECIADGVARSGDPFRIASDIWPALHGVASLRQFAPSFPWPPLEDQVRGILETFTGIHYGSATVEEAPADDGPT
jgi:AcrR family transcriptional regulator